MLSVKLPICMLILLHVHRETHEPQFGSCVSLYCDACYVSHFNFMPQCCSVSPLETHRSYGCHLLDHLAADRTSLLAGKIAVITVLEVNADFGSSFHLELIHRIACGRIDETITGITGHGLHLLFVCILGFCPCLSFAAAPDIFKKA